jgi:hypothetical protein
MSVRSWKQNVDDLRREYLIPNIFNLKLKRKIIIGFEYQYLFVCNAL